MNGIEVWNFINSGIFIVVATAVCKYVRDMSLRSKAEKERREQLFDEMVIENKKLIDRVDELSKKYDELLGEVKALQETIKQVGAGGLTILRDRILQSCRVFIERGSITLMAKDNIKDMYHYYHDIYGKNGIVQEYYEMMMKLPLEDTPIVSKYQGDSDIL